MKKERKQIIDLLLSKLFSIDFNKKAIDTISEKQLAKLNNVLSKDDLKLTFGIGGKSFSGKSTTVRTIFGVDAKIGIIKRGTDHVKRYNLALEKRGAIEVIDFAGLQESTERDEQIIQEYIDTIPECDVLLWVIKIKDNALAFDKKFISHLNPEFKRNKLIIGLSQVDETHPGAGVWNLKKKLPHPIQYEYIQERRKEIASFFDMPLDKVIDYCAHIYDLDGKTKDYRYNLVALITRLFEACDDNNAVLIRKAFSPDIIKQIKKQSILDFFKF